MQRARDRYKNPVSYTHLTSANIKAVGQGLNTVGLVQKALRMKEEERKKGREYDQCWVCLLYTSRLKITGLLFRPPVETETFHPYAFAGLHAFGGIDDKPFEEIERFD